LSYDYHPYGSLGYEKRELKFDQGFQETQLQIDGKKSFLFLHQYLDKKTGTCITPICMLAIYLTAK
jgi:hypothetical protein